MSDKGPVGPYEEMPLEGGGTVPLYLITFDQEGRCQSPRTLAFLLREVESGKFTDVHLFSHGWNNVFKDALTLYRKFFGHYLRQRDERGLNDPAKYRPALVGIIWPSTLLVLPWEATPKIAALVPGEMDEEAASDAEALRGIAASIRGSDVSRLYELSERGPTLSPDEARELANILLPIYQKAQHPEEGPEIEGASNGSGGESEIAAEQLLGMWQQMAPDAAEEKRQPGFAPDRQDGGNGSSGSGIPLTAGFLSWLDPRGPIRLASVLQMKDRAGTVGARGVGPRLTRPLLALNKARIHLIGHSYGAKVILSSLCHRPVESRAASLLLLQPAVSYLCFGQKIDGKKLKGGYRAALERVEQPIYSTFSASDVPLRRLFHLAVVRNSDWGEQIIAGLPPSRFAALGGYGPGALAEDESKTIEMPSPGATYPRPKAGLRIYGVNGSNGQITGHGDVATRFTAWAHLNLVSGSALKDTRP